MKTVIESPLAGDTIRNLRYALWCCRAVWLHDGAHALASHLLNPWYMDDSDPSERQAGIDNPWVWDADVPHCFFIDLGMTGGMRAAEARCGAERIPTRTMRLETYAPECWGAFARGEWPPHTKGFEVM